MELTGKHITFSAFEVGKKGLAKETLQAKLQTEIQDQKRRGYLHSEYVVVVEGNELQVLSEVEISEDAAKLIDHLFSAIPQAFIA